MTLNNYLSKELFLKSYIYAVILCFLMFSIEIFNLSYVLMSASYYKAFLFLISWFSYYFIYFLSLSVILSSFLIFHKIIGTNKIYIFFSFGVSKLSLLKRTIFISILPISISILGTFFINNEKVKAIEYNITYSALEKTIENAPPKYLFNVGKTSVFFEKREKKYLKNVLLIEKDKYIYAQKAFYKDGSLFVENGEIVSKKENKYFLDRFQTLKLPLSSYAYFKINKALEKKEEIGLIINNLITPIYISLGIFLPNKLYKNTFLFYSFLGIISIFHEIIRSFITFLS